MYFRFVGLFRKFKEFVVSLILGPTVSDITGTDVQAVSAPSEEQTVQTSSCIQVMNSVISLAEIGLR